MKRSEELAPLSRDHHRALEIALRLKRASDADRDEVRRRTLEFWTVHCEAHFRAEEEELVPAFLPHAGADDADVARMLEEHVELRARMTALADAGTSTAELQALGAALSDHVRFEERTLFPRVEAALPPAELAALGRALD